MRISDWSSDVCSSDLLRKLLSAFPYAASALSAPASAWRSLGLPASCAEPRRSADIRERASAALAWLEQDRKSVVEGKSVSVRVALGGRRIIKKESTIIHHSQSQSDNRTKRYHS